MTAKFKFPKVMCTQHPDSVSRYISTQEELNEATEAVRKYGCDEYMPDYEGKTTPYHQNVQIVSKLIETTDAIPGKDIFITPRAPSAAQENRFRQLMVMMSVAEANYAAFEYSDVPAISELVHPMTKTIQEIVEAQQHMIDVSELAKKEFSFEMEPPRIIPLIEDASGLLNAKSIVYDTILAYREQLNETIEKYRVFMGKSDSSLAFGHIASTLSCKYAITTLHELEADTGIGIGIIFEGGALPFRGHVTLRNSDNFFKEYCGVDTITLQSGLRYDHEEGDAEEFVRRAKDQLSGTPETFSDEEKEELINIIGIAGASYNREIRHLSSTISCIADFLPQNRDRLAHRGGTGYARDAPDVEGMLLLCREDIAKELKESMPPGGMNLPRAIKFTGALYSIGLPPEVIGTGSAIAGIKEKLGEEACEQLITKYFPSLQSDLEFAFKYLDLNAAFRFLPDKLTDSFQKNIGILRDTFDLEIDCEPTYRVLLETAQSNLLYVMENSEASNEELTQLTQSTLSKMGKMRKSLG